MNILRHYLKRQLSLVSGMQIANKGKISEKLINRISVRTPQNITQKSNNVLKFNMISRNSSNDITKRLHNLLPKTASNVLFPLQQQRDLHETSSIPKKRVAFRKRRNEHQEKLAENGYFTVMAFATAEEYDLEKLLIALKTQDLYEPQRFFNSDDSRENEPDVLYAKAKYQVGKEERGLYFFREGTVVMWNFSDMESSNMLAFLKNYEQDSYDENIVLDESEIMFYNYSKENQTAALKNGNFYITKSENDNVLERYTFSNAMSLSVKLGIWEASLDKYVDSMAYVTEDLKQGNKIKITRPDMLRKTGELFALRHLINLSSDLLDTPDFYWDREQLENLYSQTYNYFNISKRTRVMNEKINHCVELADLITSNLNDIHHVRLEKIIIYLILIEVIFEFIHYAERYYG
ncbi:hypothetical protein PVAND_009159 [Polypedilum vanderplanki]|uniref:DUF155 domain-containing protein n=1 Tax=Polypedilum vanderplanki TaxID=319348 RepID=A0A9J6CC92_POLVA|nr:hypothetical protein PVAND_009159 [Polypedilum vanderplanki]